MSYPKDLLDIKRNLLKEVSSAALVTKSDNFNSLYYDQSKIILDARKAFDGLIPYSGLGANSTNDYFSSIDLIGGTLKTDIDCSNVDLSLSIGGRYSNRKITSDIPFFVSGMSYGSLKLPAKIALHLALNQLADDGIRVIMNTGEGGALPWEVHDFNNGNPNVMDQVSRLLKEHNLDSIDREQLFRRKYPLVVQYASGRFWKDPDYLLNADAIEIKIGQGAKIGHGGLLPGSKVTELVAENRGIPPYKSAHSPSRHLDILGPEDLVAKILELRELTDWNVPIIVKVGASRVQDDISIILKSFADAAAIDGYVGGTGAAPWEIRDSIGVNTIPAIRLAKDAIDNYYSKRDMDEFKLIAHGGIWDSKRIAKCISLGSNGVGIGTGFLISMGCTLVQDCYTNTCPAGLTGSYEKLDIQSSVNRIVNYIKGTRVELQNIVGSLGKKRIQDLNKEDLHATDEISNLVSGLSTNASSYYNKIKNKDIDNILRDIPEITKK
ncbi:Glutamate synthase (NADPH) large chain [Candidatus Nitrosocosmicus oleophilus]|jgi:glutamate synthase domain-containing protein 2|uniref:Glutamate synthase (NADPH) large chain n=1 Tax=Candidatus Nitrosocosmicus oleophilus TaxID=1353260 RepID=A0A654M2F0_9ARCH|nr:FMN-binding glutamate synthase family protein [Candidatus Nitrosocosmicus oleophilus]ALI37367.1 Glutamate synthase (NADPH) large chain [Candidatus Nitrosocosmicus oleophilus]HTH20589.1 FMN-binding glutamate synthase family protein [Nitrososphaeraceae archaeon]